MKDNKPLDDDWLSWPPEEIEYFHQLGEMFPMEVNDER